MVPRALQHNLNAVLSLDLDTGFDFRLAAKCEESLELLTKHEVEWLMLCPPCGPFSPLQELWNFKRMNPWRVQQLLAEGRHFLKHAMTCAKLQVRSNRKFCFEHPARASSWEEACVQEVRALPGVHCVTFDMCCFGLVSKVHKRPIRKRTKRTTIVKKY